MKYEYLVTIYSDKNFDTEFYQNNLDSKFFDMIVDVGNSHITVKEIKQGEGASKTEIQTNVEAKENGGK